MTTHPLPNPAQTRATLEQLVAAWDRRQRARELLLAFPLALMPALGLGLLLALVARLRPLLPARTIAALTLLALGISVVVLLVRVLAWPRPQQTAAQRFDVLFGLQERVSTALELLGGRIATRDDLALRQLDDAVRAASGVRPASALPLEVRWRHWAVVLLLVAILTVLLLPNPQQAVLAQGSAEQQLAAGAADTVRDLIQDVAADPNLPAEPREQLLQQLETRLDALQQPGVRQEEAFAALNEVGETLRDAGQALQDAFDAQQRALNAALGALGEGLPPRDTAGADGQTTSQSLEEAFEQLRQEIASGDPARQQAAADAMREAADALEGVNPQAAQSLRDAADALERGDAREAGRQASAAEQQLGQQQQGAQRQQQSAQQLQQGADQAGQAAQEIAQGGPPQQQGQQQPGQQAQQGAPQPGQQPGGQQQPGQQGPAGQSGQAQGASPSEGNDARPGDSGLSAPQQGGSTGQNAPGAGDDDAQGGGTFRADTPGDSNNNPDGAGERPAPRLFAPQRIGGEGGPPIVLEPDAGNVPFVEGEFAPNPTGASAVPYSEVYADYAGAAAQALDSATVPLGLRDVVRGYFDALAPRSSPPPTR